MAVDRRSRSITLTEVGDEVVGPFLISEIHFNGTGLAPGDRCTVMDSDSSSVICDHFIADSNEDVAILQNRRWVKKIKITVEPTGDWSVLVNIL